MRRTHGMTLIELLVVLAITAILLMLAVPSFTDQMARRRIEGVATDLSTDLHFARSQAVSDRTAVRVMTVSATQYVVRNAANVDVKTVTVPEGITATNAVTVTFEPLRGTATVVNGPIDLTSTRTAGQMRLDINVMGRVNLCSPGGTLAGYASC